MSQGSPARRLLLLLVVTFSAAVVLLPSAVSAAGSEKQRKGTGVSRLGHARRQPLLQQLSDAVKKGDLEGAKKLQAAAQNLVNPKGRRLQQAQVNLPTYNCTVLAAVFGPLEPCAEPSCFTFYQIRRSATTGDVVCANVAPFPLAGPTPPAAPSLGFPLFIPYDYDYFWDNSGADVVVGASSINQVARQTNTQTAQNGNEASTTFTASTTNRFIPVPFFGTKGDAEGTGTLYDITAGVKQDGSSPLTYQVNGASGLSTTTLAGAYIPGTTYAVRKSGSGKGTAAKNVAVNIANPALFGYVLGKKK